MTPMPSEQSRDEVEAVIARFVEDFSHLRWEPFWGAFSRDVTVFHPFPQSPTRLDDQDAVEAHWRVIFDHLKSASAGPDYLRLSPDELLLQRATEDVVIATFHLRSGPGIGRRTLVLRREAEGWRIIHLHASNIEAPD